MWCWSSSSKWYHRELEQAADSHRLLSPSTCDKNDFWSFMSFQPVSASSFLGNKLFLNLLEVSLQSVAGKPPHDFHDCHTISLHKEIFNAGALGTQSQEPQDMYMDFKHASVKQYKNRLREYLGFIPFGCLPPTS